MSNSIMWHDTRLKNLFASVRNGIWGEEPDDETDVFCARGTDFDRIAGRISESGMPRRSVIPSILRSHQLQRGDLVLEKSGGSAGQPVGSVALFDLPIRAVCSNFNARLRVNDSVDPRFACYKLNSLYWSGFTRQFIKQTTGIQNLDANEFLSQHSLLPPLDEQRRIANFLDAETNRIDQLVRLRRAQLALLDEHYKNATSETLTPGITSDSERSRQWTWLPLSIQANRLGHSARVQSGVTVHAGREHADDDAEYPYLRVANVQGGELDLSEIKSITLPSSMASRSMLVPGDVVMTEANGNPDNLGRGAVWRGEIAGMVHQNHVFAIRVDRSKLLPEYLSALLSSVHGRLYFRFTSTQVGIATTTSAKVLDFPVPIFSLHEQAAMVERFRRANCTTKKASDALACQVALLIERRQALITAAVTGQIDVTATRGIDAVAGVGA